MIKKSTYFLIGIILPVMAFSQTKIDLQWSKSLGGSKSEEPYIIGSSHATNTAMVADDDENLFIVTSTTSEDGDVGKSFGEVDGWLLKLNSKGDTLWTRVFGGSKFDSPLDMVLDGKGGCVVVGITFSDDGDFLNTGHHGTTDEEDGFVAFFDKDGNIEKIKQYGGKLWFDSYEGEEFSMGGNDGLCALTTTDDGNFMAVGYTNSTESDLGPRDETQSWAGWFLKFDHTGKKISSNKISYDVPGNIFYWSMSLCDVVQDADGHYVAFGKIGQLGEDYLWAVKTDGIDNINKIWSEVYTSQAIQFPRSIVKKDNGNFILAGLIMGGYGDVNVDTYGHVDPWILEINNKNGGIVNQNVFGGTDRDYPKEIYPLKNGNFVVVGATHSPEYKTLCGGEEGDFWLVELNSNLDTLRTHRFGGSGKDELSAIAESKAGDAFYLAGLTESSDCDVLKNNGESDLWIAKLTAEPTLSIPQINNYVSNVKCIQTSDQGVFSLINAGNNDIHIFDILGKQISTQHVKSDNEILNLSNAGKGVFFISFTNKNIETIKVVIN